MTYQEQQAVFSDIKDAYFTHFVSKANRIECNISHVEDWLKCLIDCHKSIGRYLTLRYALFTGYCIDFAVNYINKPADEVLDVMEDILTKKGNDYAGSDRLSNFKRAAELSGLKPLEVCLSAIGTKIARLEQLFASGKPPENESIIDSIIDLCNYAFLLYCIVIENP
jgi:hypothetical protein